MTRAVIIRGIEYPSQRAAADALGVKPATISAARDAGTLDFVGLGPCDGERKARTSNRETIIAGKVYPSRTAAAQALGLSLSAVCGYARVADPEPVTIAGRSFASMSAAARALGVKPAEIRAWQKLQSIISALA